MAGEPMPAPAAPDARAEVPAMPNAHSHAFQRALRGRAERPPAAAGAGGDFWGWREQMFDLAGRLEPNALERIATAAFAEMRAAGYGTVGEFHYVHHRLDGSPYAEPNAMAFALARAATRAGIGLVLLPAAYHRAGWDGHDLPAAGAQRRFCDPDVETFLDRVDALRAWAASRPDVEVGIAAHSVRAVPASWLEAIAAYADAHDLVRHVHACEQRRELSQCAAEHGCTPIELMADTGFLGERTSVIHGIHVDAHDVELLASSGTIVVTCPTTEGNLGDGHLPALAYRDAGVRLALGSDSQVRIDPFEEARELETGARRAAQSRTGLLTAQGSLWAQLARHGRASLGLTAGDEAAAGVIVVHRDHPQLAGADDLSAALVTCAGAAVVARPADPPVRIPG